MGGLAVLFTCNALIIWIFQATNDFWITLFILFFVCYPGTIKATGVWMYLSRWQNNIDGPANEQERIDRIRVAVGKDLSSYSKARDQDQGNGTKLEELFHF